MMLSEYSAKNDNRSSNTSFPKKERKEKYIVKLS